jgi:hypothetical protein
MSDLSFVLIEMSGDWGYGNLIELLVSLIERR